MRWQWLIMQEHTRLRRLMLLPYQQRRGTLLLLLLHRLVNSPQCLQNALMMPQFQHQQSNLPVLECSKMQVQHLFMCNPLASAVLFFRPTPSWLPPGRYTRSIAAKRWIVIIMQGCLLVDSHKSTGSGPVRSPASCPSKKSKKTQPETKETKQTKNTQPQPNQTKHREVGSLPAMGITCMMTTCVSLWEMPPNKKQNKENTESHKGAR